MTTATLTTHPPANEIARAHTGLLQHRPESKRPTSTLLFPSSIQSDTLVDMGMPTSQQWALLRQLHTIQSIPESERWPGADWPTEQAFDDARLFIRRLPPVAIHLPDVGLADDGEVNFLWKQNGLHIDLGFYGTGAFSYFARTADGRKFYGDDIPAANGLPYDISNLIRA